MTHAQWLDELLQPTRLGAIRQRILWRLRSKIHETCRHMHDLEQIEIDVLNSLHTMLSRMDREPDTQQLHSIVHVVIDNKVLDSIRSVNRRKRSHLTLQMQDMESVVSERTGPDEDVQFEELKRLLLEQLEPRIREVIQLRLHSNQQIADMLGRSIRTVERAVRDSETVVAKLFGLSLNSYRDKTRQDKTQDSRLKTQDNYSDFSNNIGQSVSPIVESMGGQCGTLWWDASMGWRCAYSQRMVLQLYGLSFFLGGSLRTKTHLNLNSSLIVGNRKSGS